MQKETIDQKKMQDILFDHSRLARIGMPEAVFSEGKSKEALHTLLKEYGKNPEAPILFTRLSAEVFESLPSDIKSAYNYHALSGTAFSACLPEKKGVSVAVISAGTADGKTAWEAIRTLQYLGISTKVYEDNGVAGLWRLTSNLDDFGTVDAIIIVAGLDAALASVLGGLTGKPLFAVPTSVGYGVANSGQTALASMLVSCSPGIGVLNIDNGYGAACAASRVINQILATKKGEK